jgi:hypothetical protein
MAGVEQVSSKPQLQQYYCYGIDHNTMIRYNAHWEPRPTGQGHYYRVEDVDAFLATLRTAVEPTPAPNVKRFKQRIDHGDVIESPSGELVRFADYERLDAWRRRLQAENERLAIRASEPPNAALLHAASEAVEYMRRYCCETSGRDVVMMALVREIQRHTVTKSAQRLSSERAPGHSHAVTCKLFPDPHDERDPVGPCTCGAVETNGARASCSLCGGTKRIASTDHKGVDCPLCKL